MPSHGIFFQPNQSLREVLILSLLTNVGEWLLDGTMNRLII